MSFSKARLRRFNEEISQVPSPGRYDPKLDTSVKGAVLTTSKRFPGQVTTSSSLDNIERASTVSSEVVFRTPQVIRKVTLTPRLQYLKEKNFDTSGSDILSSDERPVMKSALKTVTRADYKRLEAELHSQSSKNQKMLLDRETEIDRLKKEIEDLKINETELKDILEESSKLASDRYKEALQLKDNLETMVQKIKVDRDEHQTFINDLNSKILELQNKKYELETVLAEKQSVIVTINDKYSDLENELKLLQEENVQLERSNTCIIMGAEEKLQKLDEEVKKKLKALPETYDDKYKEEQISFQTKMNYITHELNLKYEEMVGQVKKSQEKVKDLERLIDKKIKEFSKDIKDADERCKYLYRELCKVEEQKEELVVSDLEKKLAIIEIQEKSDSCKSDLDQCRNTCRKYQVTLNTMNETITALSNRLLDSEKEVERLNGVEEELKLQKQFLEGKSQLLLNDIAALRGSMDKMEEEIIQDVSALKEYLEAKADIFKEEAIKTEQALNNVICEKQSAIDILMEENEYFKNEVERKEILIEDLKKREIEMECKIAEREVEMECKIKDFKFQLSAVSEKLILAENQKMDLEKYNSDLQCQLKFAKERIKTEIPKLEHDTKYMAQNILELNLTIDCIKEEMELLKTNISCLQAEKDGLNNILQESKSKISVMKETIESKNLAISALNEEKSRINIQCEDFLSQLESLSAAYEKQNEEMKLSVEKSIALIEAEEKLSDLEAQLSEKDKEIGHLTQRLSDTPELHKVDQLEEELEELQVKYVAVLEDRDKLSHEVGELMGHQNIHQKIKHVAELKQNNKKLMDENEILRLDNLKLRSKIENMKKQSENNKENLSVTHKEEKIKATKPSSVKKKLMSPGVLKPSNH